MIYYPENTEHKIKAKMEFNRLINNSKPFMLKEKRETRSSKQNRALHLYFEFVASELNDLGITFQYKGIRGTDLESSYTPELVKEQVWKPIQTALFGTDSTTKLDTKQIDRIIEILAKFFAERGVLLEFPSINNLIL